jgi:hypothetical protein
MLKDTENVSTLNVGIGENKNQNVKDLLGMEKVKQG